uniref:Oxysterol-binding protein n=1 Tax=Astatotilapia calliptera TaxID=8154 RepID=A0AAX7W1B3_ASTCA
MGVCSQPVSFYECLLLPHNTSDHMENIDGYLMKYTNLVTGWQYRFFVLNNEAGLLEYFVNEQSRPQKPRGMLPLAGAVISPSDEDSHTFTVNAISGEQYKLRASDAKERQHWVSRLQICTQHHTEAMGKVRLTVPSVFIPEKRHMTIICTMVGLHWIILLSRIYNCLVLKSVIQKNFNFFPPLSSQEQEDIDAEDELEDSFTDKEEDLGAVEEERSVILHLLSQLKLGMDLTRVVLPTFILEKRSLLEMYADFMSHPDLFVTITDGSSPEDRMVRFVEYYLTSFHEGRKGAIAKKPYNPIIGETFHCSWKVPKRPDASKEPSQGSPDPTASSQDSYQVRFVAEQVSHHPPVSGFYAECQERRMCVNTHVWTKSKFMGMSIGVSMVGEGCLYLLEHDEEYTFTLPCAYARSILTVPWVELGGKVTINCAKSGYSAVITFQTKPFYGGKLHKVTAEVKHNSTNAVVCRVQGEWNGVLEFSFTNGETRVVDVTRLPVTKKHVRPVEKQGPTESRRLWQHVTEALRQKDVEKATEHKTVLEERQRTEERHRVETETPWRTRYFDREGEGWVYHKPLWKNSTFKS